MGSEHKPNYSRVRAVAVLAFVLAVLFVVFGAQAASHSHDNTQDETTCQICQVAHIGSAQEPVILSLLAPLLTHGVVRPFVLNFHQEVFFHDCPSRAPPSA